MNRKGQIVEILANSLVYKKVVPTFGSKKEELYFKSKEKDYSLFDGILVGEHNGCDQFNIGQRKKIAVGGKKAPLYVIGIDKMANRVFVGSGLEHPGLYTKVLMFTKNINQNDDVEISLQDLEAGVKVGVIISENPTINAALLFQFDQHLFLEFDKPIYISAKDQSIKIILKDQLIFTINNETNK